MSGISRFGVSINKDLLDKFDKLIKSHRYPTRSKAIEDLMINYLTKESLTLDNTDIIGTINIVYDHHKRELLRKVTEIQHDFQDIIISTQHIHINHNDCFEMIIVKGQKKQAEKLFSNIKSTKGIMNASLNMFSI